MVKGLLMSEAPFERFIQLVEFDQATNRLVEEAQTLEKKIEHNRDNSIKIKNDLLAAEERARNARLFVKEKESHMEILGDKQQQKEKQLEKVTSTREYSSLTHEIEALKKAQHVFEPELIAAWNELEKENMSLKALQMHSTHQLADLATALEKDQIYLVEVHASISRRDSDRSSFIPEVPPDLLEKYKGLQTRLTNPIVPVKKGACSICGHIMPPQHLNRIHLHVLEQCKNCFRFLYDRRGA